MKQFIKYILPAICLILAASCSRQDEEPQPLLPAVSEKQRIPPSRFGGPASSLAHSDLKSKSGLPDEPEPEYYLPVYSGAEFRNINPGRSVPLPAVSQVSASNNGKSTLEADRNIPVPEYASSYVRDYAFFSISFDNDIFDNTDYYYTNGLCIEIVHPVIQASPVSLALLPDFRNSINYYGIKLIQNIYTPIDPENNNIQYGDRPFASYLYISHEKISNEPERGIKLSSSLDLGIIGPEAFGGLVQSTFHEKDPVGWDYQITNDVVINYNAEIEKGFFSGRSFEAGGSAAMQAGTLYDNIQCGLFFIIGKTNGYFNSHNLTTGRENIFRDRIRYYFNLDLMGKFVVYDATMQGGVFHKSSVYLLKAAEINRFVVNGAVGIGIGLGKFSLEAQQVFVSPEFRSGRPHLWGRIKMGVNLD